MLHRGCSCRPGQDGWPAQEVGERGRAEACVPAAASGRAGGPPGASRGGSCGEGGGGGERCCRRLGPTRGRPVAGEGPGRRTAGAGRRQKSGDGEGGSAASVRRDAMRPDACCAGSSSGASHAEGRLGRSRCIARADRRPLPGTGRAPQAKHAVDQRGVAHLVLPDEVQELPSDATAASPEGRARRAHGRRCRGDVAAAARLLATAQRPVFVVGHRRPAGPRRAARARRAARRAGADHLQGQGAGAGHASARRRRARAERDPGRELADERVGPTGRRGCVVLEPHRDRGVQADRADRRPPRRRSAASTR